MTRNYIRGFASILMILTLGACAPINTQNRDIDLQTISESKNVSMDWFGETDYSQRSFILSAGDTVELKYLLREDFNDTYKVRRDGRITLPFIGSVLVAGKSPEEAQEEIHQAYIDWMARETQETDTRQYRIQVADQLEIRFPYNEYFV